MATQGVQLPSALPACIHSHACGGGYQRKAGQRLRTTYVCLLCLAWLHGSHHLHMGVACQGGLGLALVHSQCKGSASAQEVKKWSCGALIAHGGASSCPPSSEAASPDDRRAHSHQPDSPPGCKGAGGFAGCLRCLFSLLGASSAPRHMAATRAEEVDSEREGRTEDMQPQSEATRMHARIDADGCHALWASACSG